MPPRAEPCPVMERRFAIAAPRAAALAASLAGCTSGATLSVGQAAGPAHVQAVALDVGGQHLPGLLGVPARPPSTLVVLGHPWLTDSGPFAADLQRLADGGVLGLALD